MISISMCMIAKNEESVLKRCLDSYSGLFDEIIIVDTGSTDNTKNIAAGYTDKIYDFEWTGNFSEARNFAFSKASCDYIFSADADEVLDDYNRNLFMRLKSVLLPEIDIVQMKYVNCSHNTVYNSKKELRPKLYKRLRTFTWISPIHETVRLQPVIFDSDIEILHMPQSSHSKRDFSIFKKSIDNGTHLENYVLRMFCKELLISGSDDDFEEFYDIFTRRLIYEYTDNDCLEAISCVLARMYRLKNLSDDFFKIALKNVAVSPCSEICLEIGDYFFNKNDISEAVLWYINASSETESVLDIRTSGDIPLRRLAQCYTTLASEAVAHGDDVLADTYNNNASEYEKQADNWKMPEEL